MKEVTTIGLDLAKNVFHLVGQDAKGREVLKKTLRRSQVLEYFANLKPCLIGMEACAGAHDWARRLRGLGHEVKLMAPQHVKGYVCGNKNDYNDARAIAEAVGRPKMRSVAIKTVEQQDVQALHRMRSAAVGGRTTLCNQLRGLLAEYGLVLPKGVAALRRRIPELLEDGENGLSGFFRQLLEQGYHQLRDLDRYIDFYTKLIEERAKHSDAEQRLQTIPGFGKIVASAFHAAIGDGRAYRRGRDVSAAHGLVPRQHSSGGKQVLLGISKRGDAYLRAQLVHGARSVLSRAHRKDDRLSRWACRVQAERGFNKAAVALANKMVRIGWAVLRHGTVYQPA